MSWVGFTEKLEGNSSVDLSESPRDFTHILVNLSGGATQSLRLTDLGSPAASLMQIVYITDKDQDVFLAKPKGCVAKTHGGKRWA